jgi:hypothetical protein
LPSFLVVIVLILLQVYNNDYVYFLLASLVIGAILDEQSLLKLILIEVFVVFVLMAFQGIDKTALANFSQLFGLNSIVMLILVFIFSSLSFAVPARIGSVIRKKISRT